MELGGMRDRPVPNSDPPRSRGTLARLWLAAGALGVLLFAAVVLGVRLAESESHVERLRAELRGVYAEAESLRTAAVRSEQRVLLLEQQVRQLRAEREALLQQRQLPAATEPARAARPARKRTRERVKPHGQQSLTPSDSTPGARSR
jgi:hypothetical protein